ncbi:MAG: YdcF family protein [bacterium]
MRRLGIALLVLVGVAATLAMTYGPLLEAAARFLIVEDRLEKANIVVVLAGGRGDERVRQAADLYRSGYAPLVMLSGTGAQNFGFSVSEVMRRQAVSNGIPQSALVFESTSTSTLEQAREIRKLLEARRVRRAIVVTSSYHTRRAAYLFHKGFAGSPVELRLYPVQRDSFNPMRWWTREEDTETVVLEYLKLGLTLVRFR